LKISQKPGTFAKAINNLQIERTEHRFFSKKGINLMSKQ